MHRWIASAAGGTTQRLNPGRRNDALAVENADGSRIESAMLDLAGWGAMRQRAQTGCAGETRGNRSLPRAHGRILSIRLGETSSNCTFHLDGWRQRCAVRHYPGWWKHGIPYIRLEQCYHRDVTTWTMHGIPCIMRRGELYLRCELARTGSMPRLLV